MQHKRITLLLILLATLLGAIAGGFVGRDYLGERKWSRSSPTRADILKEFSAKVKLDPVQVAQVDTILERHRPKFSEIKSQYSERIKQQRDSLRAEIRRLLSPEQNRLYDEYIKELEEREMKMKQNHRKD